MSKAKQQVREAFRKTVLGRDGGRCRACGRADLPLDAHHIIDRHELPHGGYVKENGIALCDAAGGCHEKAEVFHRTGVAAPGFAPADLFAMIGSDPARALAASERLGR